MAKYRDKVPGINSAGATPILIVIDMQVNFTSDQGLIDSVEQEIKAAVQASLPVALVRYLQCGNIHQQLVEAAGLCPGNTLQFEVAKSDDDGVSEIIGACRRYGLRMEHLRICGVNTNACVEDTTLSLADKLPNCLIELLGYACRNESMPNNFLPFSRRNLRVVKERAGANAFAA